MFDGDNDSDNDDYLEPDPIIEAGFDDQAEIESESLIDFSDHYELNSPETVIPKNLVEKFDERGADKIDYSASSEPFSKAIGEQDGLTKEEGATGFLAFLKLILVDPFVTVYAGIAYAALETASLLTTYRDRKGVTHKPLSGFADFFSNVIEGNLATTGKAFQDTLIGAGEEFFSVWDGMSKGEQLSFSKDFYKNADLPRYFSVPDFHRNAKLINNKPGASPSAPLGQPFLNRETSIVSL